MTECMRDSRINIAQIYDIKMAIIDGDYDCAIEMWSEFDEIEQTALWIAPTYGGIFTTEERKRLRPTTTEETV
jgi:hypothetical protein